MGEIGEGTYGLTYVGGCSFGVGNGLEFGFGRHYGWSCWVLDEGVM